MHAQVPELGDVITRVHAHVLTFESQLAAVVAEETYVQTVDTGGAASRSRTLRSDYALTRVGGRSEAVGYRDTFEVDGRPVRDREERLQRLLTSGASDQAARIADENARFNLAGDLLSRNINVPTFALELLHPRYRERFSAKRIGTGVIDGRVCWEIEFRERERPTIVRTPEGRDQPSRLLALVDPASGQVWRTTVSWQNITGSIVVTYGYAATIPTLVPLTMSERYVTRGGSRIGGEASYTNYRRFETSGRILPGGK
jgi:hypothetical protein